MRSTRRMQLALAMGTLSLGACATTTVNQVSEEQAIRNGYIGFQSAASAHDADRIASVLGSPT
ncbi:MAG: hypothetical protein M3Z54_01030 [Gemmatimonadota bacterium]|nr:hypothetical protein [Gemmatimonadota bacterium]